MDSSDALSRSLSVASGGLIMCVILGEAVRLARDFSYLCETEFPTRQAAEYVVRQNPDSVDPPHRKQMALAAK